MEDVLNEHDSFMEPKLLQIDEFKAHIASLTPDLRQNLANAANTGDGDNVSSSGAEASIRLPKLPLEEFHGQVDTFKDFEADQLTNVFHNKELNGAQKMAYLRRSVHGEAKAIIAGYALTLKDYHAAWNKLVDRFGRTERQKMRHIAGLLNMSAPKQGRGVQYVNQLYSVLNEVTLHVRGLETLLESDTLKAEDILIPLVISKYPDSIKHEYSKTFRNKQPVLSEVLDFLNEEIQRYEYISDFNQTMSLSEHAETIEKHTLPTIQKGTATMLQVKADSDSSVAQGSVTYKQFSCVYCRGPHENRRCPIFWASSIVERRELVKRSRLCFRCLRQNHRQKDCNEVCKICQGAHAAPICDRQPSAPPNTLAYNFKPATWENKSYTNNVFPTSQGNIPEPSNTLSPTGQQIQAVPQDDGVGHPAQQNQQVKTNPFGFH